MKLGFFGMDLFVVPAETIKDGYQPSLEEKYGPTTLVMAFEPGELEEFVRLING